MSDAADCAEPVRPRKPYRSAVGGTPFMTEGWSLYWELLMWDLGFHKSPEDRIGALACEKWSRHSWSIWTSRSNSA